jgi:Tfp pilus assembly protein PilF
LLLHLATSLLLFQFWWRATEEMWPSALAATLFAVHPQHVESVACIAERGDVLSGLLLILTLAAYLAYIRSGRTKRRYAVVFVLQALGLMAQPMLVSVPALLFLLDYWPLGRFGTATDPAIRVTSAKPIGFSWLALEKLPLVALSVGDCLINLRTHSSDTVSWPWKERVGNALVACATYLVQFFVPVDLAVYYPVAPGGFPIWKIAASAGLLAVITFNMIVACRRAPYLLVGWFWFLGMLIPVLGLVGMPGHVMADHYSYLPGIGLAVAVAWGAVRLAGEYRERRQTLAALAGVAILLLVGAAAWQTTVWRDDETLWRHAIASTSENAVADCALADALVQQQKFDEAADWYARARKFATDATPYFNLGALYARQGKLDQAIVEYLAGLAVEPDSYNTHFNLALALQEKGVPADALVHFTRAIELGPEKVEAHHGLGRMLLSLGKLEEARAELELAAALDHTNPLVQADLGLLSL